MTTYIHKHSLLKVSVRHQQQQRLRKGSRSPPLSIALPAVFTCQLGISSIKLRLGRD